VAQGQADAAVIRAKGEADARLISADAESKALAQIAAALKDRPELLSYQYIIKLAPNTSVMVLPSNTPFLYNLPGLNLPNTNVPSATPVVPTPAPSVVPTPAP
jgi:regulator of protease activity HflC (stomatin/prohibitin superfamily)